MNCKTEAGILHYLQSRDKTQNIVAVKKLSAGNNNYVHRGTIAEPRTDLFGGRSTVVIKHAADHSASNTQVALNVDRMALRRPSSALWPKPATTSTATTRKTRTLSQGVTRALLGP
ncbi:hypothetical protein BGZ75_009300 [Mortierella antarctica]|nr:hypothetical protein BGZ75_009300 [Mortierella antarctica]